MTTPTLEQLTSAMPSSLGTYAPVLREIENALQSPEHSLATVGTTIEKDLDLTARLLRLGNSPFYGFSRRLATVTEVISLIGIQQVQDLIVASSIIKEFAGLGDEFVSMESFWRHNLACGIAARALALERRLAKPEQLFVAGLLHDMGRLALFAHAPDAARQVFGLYGRERMLLVEAESRVLGYDHARIARVLLQQWRFPVTLAEAVAYHHQPAGSQIAGDEAAVVHLADHLVNAMQVGHSGERFVPPLDVRAWERLQLPRESLARVVDTVDEQLEALRDSFLTH